MSYPFECEDSDDERGVASEPMSSFVGAVIALLFPLTLLELPVTTSCASSTISCSTPLLLAVSSIWLRCRVMREPVCSERLLVILPVEVVLDAEVEWSEQARGVVRAINSVALKNVRQIILDNRIPGVDIHSCKCFSPEHYSTGEYRWSLLEAEGKAVRKTSTEMRGSMTKKAFA